MGACIARPLAASLARLGPLARRRVVRCSRDLPRRPHGRRRHRGRFAGEPVARDPRALPEVQPGDTILAAGGAYRGFTVSNLARPRARSSSSRRAETPRFSRPTTAAGNTTPTTSRSGTRPTSCSTDFARSAPAAPRYGSCTATGSPSGTASSATTGSGDRHHALGRRRGGELRSLREPLPARHLFRQQRRPPGRPGQPHPPQLRLGHPRLRRRDPGRRRRDHGRPLRSQPDLRQLRRRGDEPQCVPGRRHPEQPDP